LKRNEDDDKLRDDNDDASLLDHNQIRSLLPASYRTGKGDDVAAAGRDVTTCIKKEFDLHRLHNIFTWLWVAGRPMPPRPLHYQLLLAREIFVTEQMDMHLVWTTGRIFLKPIPRFLLEPYFWTTYLTDEQPCSCFGKNVDGKSRNECKGGLRTCALGFLFSYTALIAHESDFAIAQEKHLLPKETDWPAWVTLVEQLDTEHIYHKIDERFKFGELRLSRLDKIYRLSNPMRGYMSHWNQYGSFFKDNFTWLASATVYIVVVLTAMQVGLATKHLGGNDAFQSASYGFTVFSILGPLVTTGLIILTFSFIFIYSWTATSAYGKKRSSHIQLWKPDIRKSPANLPA
jgi:hypothetical protein